MVAPENFVTSSVRGGISGHESGLAGLPISEMTLSSSFALLWLSCLTDGGDCIWCGATAGGVVGTVGVELRFFCCRCRLRLEWDRPQNYDLCTSSSERFASDCISFQLLCCPTEGGDCIWCGATAGGVVGTGGAEIRFFCCRLRLRLEWKRRQNHDLCLRSVESLC